MLKKLYRLNKTKDIQALLKTGKAYYAPVLMLKVKANELPVSRFTVIVSNRISKKATQRNLIKRRIREIVRLLWTKMETGADVVVLASPKIIDSKGKVLGYEDLSEVLEQILKKARLL